MDISFNSSDVTNESYDQSSSQCLWLDYSPLYISSFEVIRVPIQFSHTGSKGLVHWEGDQSPFNAF